MPTYQYACTECGQDLEVVQKFSDDPLVECPSCQGRLRKVYSAVGVVFKGSGFYRTDSRKASEPKAGAKTGATDSKPSSKPSVEGSSSGTTSGSSGTSGGTGSTGGSGSTSGSTKVA